MRKTTILKSSGSDEPGPSNCYAGKDGTTWRKTAFARKVRIRARNILIQTPGPKDKARTTQTEIDIWNLFFFLMTTL